MTLNFLEKLREMWINSKVLQDDINIFINTGVNYERGGTISRCKTVKENDLGVMFNKC